MIDSSIGLDPGVTTGMAFLDYEEGRLAGRSLLQCDHASAPVVLKGMLLAYYGPRNPLDSGQVPVGHRSGSVEAFRDGHGAGSVGNAAKVTRQLVMELTEVLQEFGYRVLIRPAADVKPWASDKRLVKGQVADDPKKINGEFRHAFDAGRHALYGAVNSGFAVDPLRAKTGARLRGAGEGS